MAIGLGRPAAGRRLASTNRYPDSCGPTSRGPRCPPKRTTTGRLELRKQADKQFRDGQEAAKQLASRLKTELELMQKRPTEGQDAVLRNQWRGYYVAALIVAPSMTLESAELVDNDQVEYRRRVQEAADELSALLEKYSTKLPDAYVQLVLQLSRAHFALEQYDESLALLAEILENPTLPDAVSAQATQLEMQCWLASSEGELDRAVTAGEQWLERHPRATAADAAPVRLALAQALLAQTESQSGRSSARLRDRARRLLIEAARGSGKSRLDAQQLLTQLPARRTSEVMPVFNSFEQAKVEGDATLGQIRVSRQALAMLRQAAAETTDDPAASTQAGETEAQLEQLLDTAISAYRQAIELADEDTPPEAKANTKLLLAYVLFEKGEYYDAAALSEFLARHSGNESAARSSARMALAAYSKLFEEAAEGGDFATRHWIDVAEYAAGRWPNDVEGQTAAVTLVRFLVAQGRIADALGYLQRLSVNSPLRAEAELTTGMGLYQKYLQSIREPSTSADADTWKQQAETLLDAGLRRSSGASPTATVVKALVTRARMYLDANQPADALETLSGGPEAPYSLVQQHSPLVADADLMEEIYRTMLRARLAGLAAGIGRQDDIRQLTEGLRAVVGDSEAGRERLVAIYVALARDLREQLQATPGEQQVSMATSFAGLLDQVAKAAPDPDVLLWTAHTLLEIADLFSSGEPGVASLREQLFSSAEEALQKVLQRVDDATDAELRQQTVIRLATVKRRRGDFRGAIPLFVDVLKESPNLVNVQMEAAATYQEGGAYRYAIKGGRPDARTGKNVIWGWERLSIVLARQMKQNAERKEQFAPLFHESRYQIAWCRFREALASTGEQRRRYLQQARQAILSIAARYPDLGGPDRKAQYDQLLQEIEQALSSTKG